MIYVRSFAVDDLPLIQGWASDRGLELNPALLSPYGFLAVEDDAPVLAVWGYMILDVPVIQLDHLTSRPGISLKKLRAAWGSIMRVIEAWILNINKDSGLSYSCIRCFCDERLLREARREGWTASDPAYFQIFKPLSAPCHT